VSSFSALSSSNRAAVHCSRDTTLCPAANGLFCTMVITFSFLCLCCFRTDSEEFLRLRPSPGSGLGLAHGAHLAAASTATVEDASAVGLEPGYGDTGGHLEALKDFTRFRIDAAEFALLGLQGAMPEFAVDPGNARDEAIGFNRAQDGAGLGVDLVDL